MPFTLRVDNGKGAQTYSKKAFAELFSIRYLDHLEFANWRAESYIRKKCAYAHKKGRIESLTLWLGKLHGKQMDLGADIDVTVKWMGEELGYGLFTNQKLKKWDYIGEYAGLLRRRGLLKRDVNDYCFQYPREWATCKPFTIDSEDLGNYTRFINHSDTPNIESISFFHDGIFRIGFRALEEIKPGCHLTYDYGGVYWKHRKKLALPHREENLLPSSP